MDWIPIGVALGGSIAGGYLGVKVTVAVLQTRMSTAEKEIESLRESRHAHAGFIQEHEGRISALEHWRDRE